MSLRKGFRLSRCNRLQVQFMPCSSIGGLSIGLVQVAEKSQMGE